MASNAFSVCIHVSDPVKVCVARRKLLEKHCHEFRRGRPIRMEQFPCAASRCLKFLFLFTLCGVAFSSAAPVFAQSNIVLYAAEASSRAGNWRVEWDTSAAGSRRMRYPDAGLPKLDTPLATPANYFELTF